MNYNKTGIEYVNSYPFVMRGEKNITSNSSSSLNNSTVHYPAVCQTDINNQYQLPNVTGLSNLSCPTATKMQTEPYPLVNNNDFTNCIPKFQDSIQVCNQDCMIRGMPPTNYTKGFQCHKVWNNHTKRRFIDARHAK